MFLTTSAEDSLNSFIKKSSSLSSTFKQRLVRLIVWLTTTALIVWLTSLFAPFLKAAAGIPSSASMLNLFGFIRATVVVMASGDSSVDESTDDGEGEQRTNRLLSSSITEEGKIPAAAVAAAAWLRLAPRWSCLARLRSIRSRSRRARSSSEMGSPLQVCGWALWAGRPGPFRVFSFLRHFARRFWNQTCKDNVMWLVKITL